MSTTRRRFLNTTASMALLAGTTRRSAIGEEPPRTVPVEELDRVAAAPVLRVDELAKPVTIAGMELLKNGRNFIVRVRTRDGAEGLSVPNAMHMIRTYPIFLNRVAPFFAGKDARRLE